MSSLVMEAADACRVPAGSALAVDREAFSGYVTEKIRSHPLIECISGEVSSVPEGEITVIATGPLTSAPMAEYISGELGCSGLHFFDAAAPIVDGETVNLDIAFFASFGHGYALPNKFDRRLAVCHRVKIRFVNVAEQVFVGAVKVARINIAVTFRNELVRAMPHNAALFGRLP